MERDKLTALLTVGVLTGLVRRTDVPRTAATLSAAMAASLPVENPRIDTTGQVAKTVFELPNSGRHCRTGTPRFRQDRQRGKAARQ